MSAPDAQTAQAVETVAQDLLNQTGQLFRWVGSRWAAGAPAEPGDLGSAEELESLASAVEAAAQKLRELAPESSPPTIY